MEGAERKAALCMLLDQETQLISAIGRHKLEADDENKDKRIQAFLNKVHLCANNSCQKTTTLAGQQPSLNSSQD